MVSLGWGPLLGALELYYGSLLTKSESGDDYWPSFLVNSGIGVGGWLVTTGYPPLFDEVRPTNFISKCPTYDLLYLKL